MASASLHTPAPTRKHTPPSPQRVYETWQHECRTAGEWGAYARTAARYHKPSGEPYSDEWARKTVKRWEAEQQARDAAAAAPVDDGIAYQPPPDGYPNPQPRPILRQAVDANSPTSTLKAPTTSGDLPTGGRDIMAAANGETPNRQPANPANSQPFELEETRAAADANHQPIGTEHPRPVPLPPGPPEPEPEPLPGPDPDPLPRPPLVQPAGIVRDYLKHQAAEVRRDGLLVLAWRWLDEHPMVGPFPTPALVLVLAGLALALLGVLG